MDVEVNEGCEENEKCRAFQPMIREERFHEVKYSIGFSIQTMEVINLLSYLIRLVWLLPEFQLCS